MKFYSRKSRLKFHRAMTTDVRSVFLPKRRIHCVNRMAGNNLEVQFRKPLSVRQMFNSQRHTSILDNVNLVYVDGQWVHLLQFI